MAKESRIPFVDGKRGSFLDYLVLSGFIAIGLVFFHMAVARYYAEHGSPKPGQGNPILNWCERHFFGVKTYSNSVSSKLLGAANEAQRVHPD